MLHHHMQVLNVLAPAEGKSILFGVLQQFEKQTGWVLSHASKQGSNNKGLIVLHMLHTAWGAAAHS